MSSMNGINNTGAPHLLPKVGNASAIKNSIRANPADEASFSGGKAGSQEQGGIFGGIIGFFKSIWVGLFGGAKDDATTPTPKEEKGDGYDGESPTTGRNAGRGRRASGAEETTEARGSFRIDPYSSSTDKVYEHNSPQLTSIRDFAGSDGVRHSANDLLTVLRTKMPEVVEELNSELEKKFINKHALKAKDSDGKETKTWERDESKGAKVLTGHIFKDSVDDETLKSFHEYCYTLMGADTKNYKGVKIPKEFKLDDRLDLNSKMNDLVLEAALKVAQKHKPAATDAAIENAADKVDKVIADKYGRVAAETADGTIVHNALPVNKVMEILLDNTAAVFRVKDSEGTALFGDSFKDLSPKGKLTPFKAVQAMLDADINLSTELVKRKAVEDSSGSSFSLNNAKFSQGTKYTLAYFLADNPEILADSKNNTKLYNELVSTDDPQKRMDKVLDKLATLTLTKNEFLELLTHSQTKLEQRNSKD
jgi:hypothetical protein